jgi:magnesium-transporting ATPase (P-type)
MRTTILKPAQPIAASRTDFRFSSQLTEKTKYMLWTIAVILIVLWALGLFTHVAGGLIHLLLVVAIIVIVVNLIRGRRMG